MATPEACKKSSPRQAEDYVQSRLTKLFSNRLHMGIGLSSPCIWGKENPVAEKRRLEEVCRDAENSPKCSGAAQKKNARNTRIPKRKTKSSLCRQTTPSKFHSVPPLRNERRSKTVRQAGSSPSLELTLPSTGRRHRVSRLESGLFPNMHLHGRCQIQSGRLERSPQTLRV